MISVSSLGFLFNGVLVIALVFVAGLVDHRPGVVVLAIVTAGVAFVSYNLRFLVETDSRAPAWAWRTAEVLAVLSAVLIVAAFAALFF